MIEYSGAELDAALDACGVPPMAPTKPRQVGNVIALTGHMPAVFAGRTDLPDMNAAAQEGIERRGFEGLAPADQRALVAALLQHPPIARLADAGRGDGWLTTLFSLAHAGHLGVPGVRDLARAWSMTSARFKAETFDRDWDSFNPDGGITIATLLGKGADTGFDLRAHLEAPAASNPTTVVAASFAPGTDPFDATMDWAKSDLIDFIYGTMLARPYVTLLGAAGGTGKSALMTGIAACCALGLPLLGSQVAHRLRVLMLNLEDGRAKLRRGVKAVMQHYRLNPSDLDGWLFIAGANDVAGSLPGSLRLIMVDPITKREVINEVALAWLRRQIMARDIDVLMIDPFSRLIRGNENAVDVVDQLMERLTLLAVEFNIAILIAQHTRKSGGGVAADGVAAFRGSGAAPDAARNAYSLQRPDAAALVAAGAVSGENIILMKHEKANLGRLEDPSLYALVGVRLPGGDPLTDPPHVEAGRWAHTVERFQPVAISQTISDPMRNAVMTAIDAGTHDHAGTPVPFGPVDTKANNPIPAAAMALQSVVLGADMDRTKRLAASVIDDLIGKGLVTVAGVRVPSYRKGKANGSNSRLGLLCHWQAVPWRQAPAAASIPPVPAAANSPGAPTTTQPEGELLPAGLDDGVG